MSTSAYRNHGEEVSAVMRRAKLEGAVIEAAIAWGVARRRVRRAAELGDGAHWQLEAVLAGAEERLLFALEELDR